MCVNCGTGMSSSDGGQTWEPIPPQLGTLTTHTIDTATEPEPLCDWSEEGAWLRLKWILDRQFFEPIVPADPINPSQEFLRHTSRILGTPPGRPLPGLELVRFDGRTLLGPMPTCPTCGARKGEFHDEMLHLYPSGPLYGVLTERSFHGSPPDAFSPCTFRPRLLP